MRLLMPVDLRVFDPQLKACVPDREDSAIAILTDAEKFPIGKRRRKPRDGGKPPTSKLLRCVKWRGKRSEFLKWFLVKPRTIDATMTQFRITRPNVFAYWTMINRDHGIGYSLSANVIAALLPVGCKAEDIFHAH